MAEPVLAIDEPAGHSVSLRIAGGPQAPRVARQFVLSHMEPSWGGAGPSADAGLLVSELVTNSVLHAGVGSDELLTLTLAIHIDRLRLTVSDSGSKLEPQLLGPHATGFGGVGLWLVEQLAMDWGVTHDPPGTTQVWCELALDADAGAPD
jgi:anti-sigma regulatory factor (Ser/Thr protein kinase)